ncbi:tripartite tricarboxylate transporter substrate-binding protein [Paracoccus sp. (in: a-proteobacteria)]|uniref:Bug family tripartite tricarboxylate transporter substrate binding protein n=1 Tax=Paracoccus sp. TaxID=267 RepID=UPI0028995162|nr:tripartite tricarboxylate transporter substrate-binding protein [Paracoccus sp. (in: a-proteobacteria)]
MFNKAKGLMAAAIVTMAGVLPAQAQDGAEFYRGKTVNYIVATEPGGGYDTNGRLVAKYMQKHLPGSTFVVRNMPGAGHMIGANYVYSAAPDGLTLGTFNTGLIYAQLTEDRGAKFDLSKMSWVGKLASDPRVLMMDKKLGIKTVDELKQLKEPVKFSAAGVGSASTTETELLIKALDLPVKIITGYNGEDGLLAIRRGETQGSLGALSSFEPFVNEGHGVFLAQIGGATTDTPQLTAEGNPAAAQAIALIASQGNISRLTAAPPGLSEERLATLRTAYEAAVTDPEFLEEAKMQGLPVDPAFGADVAKSVSEALNQSPEMVDYLKATLKSKSK